VHGILSNLELAVQLEKQKQCSMASLYGCDHALLSVTAGGRLLRSKWQVTEQEVAKCMDQEVQE
jgi:hypothetical protein